MHQARGSLFEVGTQLELADRLGYFAFSKELDEQVNKTGAKLNSFIAALRSRLAK